MGYMGGTVGIEGDGGTGKATGLDGSVVLG